MDNLLIISDNGKEVKGIKDKTAVHVSIPNGVVSICRNAFEDCVFLQNIEIPDSVNVIGSCAFQGCKSLRRDKIITRDQKILNAL